MKLYKFLDGDQSCHGGAHTWSLPTDDGPGEWTTPIDDLSACERGYHLCRVSDLAQWPAPDLYEAEARGDVLEVDDKVIAHECRLVRRVDAWTEQSARAFACDCAEHVLPIFDRLAPDDDRPRKAIETARRFARGEADQEELAAAWDAARDAARAAARAAARDADRAASWAAAWDVARDADRAADRAAARDAARDAAMAAALSAAARTAAWAAARTAAWATARAAARDAAMAASRDAERKWQTARLCEVLGIEEEFRSIHEAKI